jgi:quercetin dioxygenase-like cupin family protein
MSLCVCHESDADLRTSLAEVRCDTPVSRNGLDAISAPRTDTVARAYDAGVEIIERAGQWTAPVVGESNGWVEHFVVPALSVGTYCVPAGGTDDQGPHTEDEIYVVTAGRSRIVTPGGSREVGPGSVIFVPAGEEHRFTDIAEDLALLVVFAPAYGALST